MKFASGRILGIDLGLKRTGLAVSDELWISTRALPNLIPKSRMQDIVFLLNLCLKLEIKFLLIGYPLLPKSLQEGKMAKRARGFYNALCEQLPCELSAFLIDETFSSIEARERLKSKRACLKSLDGESARILIETFIYDQVS